MFLSSKVDCRDYNSTRPYDQVNNILLYFLYDALYGEVLLRGIIIPDHSTLADNVDNADPSEYDSFYV